MKKPFSTSSAFAFLFVMAAVTPQSVWASNKCEFNGRSPASDEQITCLKEEKDRLEKDMKKLVEDKEKIVKQLDELKSSNKESSEDKPEKKDGKKAIAESRDQDMTEMMAYISYMMVSQQEQQMAVLNQMYSFMTQSMQSFVYPQQQYDFGFGMQQARWNPYSLEGVGQIGYQQVRYNNQFSFDFGNGAGNGIGIGMNGQSFYQNPYSQNQQEDFVKTPYRYPAQIPNQLERSQLIAPPSVSGYDFNPAAPMQSQQQQPQIQQPVYRPQQMDRKPPLDA